VRADISFHITSNNCFRPSRWRPLSAPKQLLKLNRGEFFRCGAARSGRPGAGRFADYNTLAVPVYLHARGSGEKDYPGDFFAEMPQFARRLETLTPPDKRVFVFGAEPELLFYARRASATRYIFLFPLYGPYGNAREKQLVAAAEVESANPPTAVYFPNLLFFTSGTDQYFTDWSRSYMEQNFYVDTLLIAGEFGTAQTLNVASDVQSDVSAAREAVIGAILVRRSHETP